MCRFADELWADGLVMLDKPFLHGSKTGNRFVYATIRNRTLVIQSRHQASAFCDRAHESGSKGDISQLVFIVSYFRYHFPGKVSLMV